VGPWWVIVWLGCGMSAEESARMEALEARVTALEAEREAAAATEAPPDAAEREARLEELRRRVEARRAARTGSSGPVNGKELLRDRDALARSARAVPHRDQADDIDGFRLSAIRSGSPLEQLGLKNGDIVHAVEGFSLTNVDEAMHAYEAVQDADRLTLAISRRLERMELTVDLTVPFEGVEADDEPAVVPSLDQLLEDPEALSKMGRALLHRGPDGAFDGYRLSGIRRGSPPALMGFENGDVLHELNGHPLTSMEEAMEAYQALRGATGLDATVTRRGERIQLRIDLPASP